MKRIMVVQNYCHSLQNKAIHFYLSTRDCVLLRFPSHL